MRLTAHPGMQPLIELRKPHKRYFIDQESRPHSWRTRKQAENPRSGQEPGYVSNNRYHRRSPGSTRRRSQASASIALLSILLQIGRCAGGRQSHLGLHTQGLCNAYLSNSPEAIHEIMIDTLPGKVTDTLLRWLHNFYGRALS